MSAAFALAWKDLRIYFRDPIGLLLGFLLPIVLVTIFGFIMGAAFGGSGPAPRVTLYVVDEDGSEASQSFLATLKKADMLRVRPRAGESALTAERAKQLVDDGEASHALIIREGFADTQPNKLEDRLLLVRDPGREMEDQIVRISMMQAMLTSRQSNWWIDSMQKMFADAGMEETQLGLLQGSSTQMAAVIDQFNNATVPEETAAEDENSSGSMDWMLNFLPVETEDHLPPARPKQASYQTAQAVAGMSVMMLMFGVTSCGRTLLTERDSGTLARLLSVGVPRQSILLGTALFTVAVGCMQMVVMFTYGEFMFRVGIFRDPVTLFVLALLWIMTSTSFGMLIAAGAKSEKQADMLATILIISMAALGGCWFPLQMLDLPTPLEIATKSTVTYWAMSGFQTMLWNAGGLMHNKILQAIAVQVLYMVCMAGGVWWLFRRNYLRG